MTQHAPPATNWPAFTEAQRACVEGALVGLGAYAGADTPSRRVVSVRAGFVILLTFETGAQSILKVSQEGEPSEISNEFTVLGKLGDHYANRVRAFTYADHTAALLLQWIEAESLSSRWVAENMRDDMEGRREDLRLVGAEVDHLHLRGLIHGDLQPTHIRFSEDSATLIDFGVTGAPDAPFGGGLVHYLAPEYASCLLGGGRPLRTVAGDWHALLASAFVAVTGKAPVSYPDGADVRAKLEAIAAKNIRPEEWGEHLLARDLAEALLLPVWQRRAWVMQ